MRWNMDLNLGQKVLSSCMNVLWACGVLRFGLDRSVLLKASLKPLHIFKGHFGRKRYPFLGIFLKITNGPMFRDIFVKNKTHVEGFLVKKRPIRASLEV